MIALDTETNGVDLRHGAQPFFVSTCFEDGRQLYWEWEIDPLTREVNVPPGDLLEITNEVLYAPKDDGWLILQNAKFDFQALETVGLWDQYPAREAWKRVRDTLIAEHLLASNAMKDLTTLTSKYLNKGLWKYEEALKKCCDEARRLARAKYPDWRIAKAGLPEMPSAKDSVWKMDMWLPRQLAKVEGYSEPAWGCKHEWDYHTNACNHCGGHRWYVVTREYANMDTAATLGVWKVQKAELVRRKLWAIYEESMKLPMIVHGMVGRGVTLDSDRLDAQVKEYGEEVYRLESTMKNIAATFEDEAGLPYDLTLPKGGTNHSLLHFCFGRPAKGDRPARTFMDLPVVLETDTGQPSLSKPAIEQYLVDLPQRSMERKFVECLAAKRSRDTAISYMEAYRRFWKHESGTTYRLHPDLNITGTDTLRFSSQNPNSQNISKKEDFNVRTAFGPRPGREWWSLDAKNIELRIPFYKAGQRELIELFERPNDPPYYGSNHLANFHVVYEELWNKELREVGLEKVGPHCKKKYASTWYQWCKNGGFAKQYGGQRRKVDSTFHRPGAFDLLDSKFNKLADYNRYWVNYANKHGYVETVPDASVDPAHGYPLLCTRTEQGGILETVPLNYHVQGTAMWWTRRAMVRCQQQLDEWAEEDGFDGFMTLQVHDEIVFDFPKSDAEPDKNNPYGSNLWRIQRLAALMAKCGEDIGVPTPVGIEYNPVTWAKGVVFA